MNLSISKRATAAALALVASLLCWHPAADAAKFTLLIRGEGTGLGIVQAVPGGVEGCDLGAYPFCYRDVDAGSTVTFTALPDAGSVFGGWSGPCTGTGTCQFAMNADKTVVATMNARPGTNYLVVSPQTFEGIGGGSVVSSPAGIDCARGSTCWASFPSSSIVTLAAFPTPGSTMAWAGDCAGAGPCQVRMDTQRFVLAMFEVQSPASLNFTALWWVPTESGWGINLNHQGGVIFATLFTYDRSGAPVWLVMPAGRRHGDYPYFAFEGDLYRTTGSPFNAVPVIPNSASNATYVGTMRLYFTGFDTAQLEYTFDGESVRKSISKQVYGSRAADCRSTTATRAAATNYQDLWWNPAESGWGINITHQDDSLFATLFTYDEAGRDLWLVMSSGRRQPDGSFSGDLYRTRGPPFHARPFTPIAPGSMTHVGTMGLRFSDGDHGTLTYFYNGTPVTRSITRQVFWGPLPICD